MENKGLARQRHAGCDRLLCRQLLLLAERGRLERQQTHPPIYPPKIKLQRLFSSICKDDREEIKPSTVKKTQFSIPKLEFFKQIAIFALVS